MDFLSGVMKPLGELPLDERQKLARLLQLRNEYLDATSKLNQLKINQLLNPTPSGDQDIVDFTRITVAPVRHSMNEAQAEVFKTSVNLDELMGFLPVVLLGLLQHVNVSLMLATIGIDSDQIADVVGKIKEYVTERLGDS